MPPKERTATSVVPPPTSTIIDPVGSVTGNPAPFDARDCHHRRLVEHDPAALDVDKGIRGAEIDRHVGGQQTKHSTNHCHGESKVAADPMLRRNRRSRRKITSRS